MSGQTGRKVCRTADEAWAAGYDAPCDHGIPNPTDCPDCRLRPEEIGRFAVLLKGLYSGALNTDRPRAA